MNLFKKIEQAIKSYDDACGRIEKKIMNKTYGQPISFEEGCDILYDKAGEKIAVWLPQSQEWVALQKGKMNQLFNK